MWAQVYFILSQSRLTDRRTDRQTEIKAPAIPFVAMHIYMLSHGKNLTILTTESSYTSAYTYIIYIVNKIKLISWLYALSFTSRTAKFTKAYFSVTAASSKCRCAAVLSMYR